MSVGMPASILLRHFGEHVLAAFDAVAYHVGSSLLQKDGWRDVDVRVLLDDDEYVRLYGDPEQPQHSKRWVATVLAWSTFGREMTGLPIDFQIQQRSHANAEFPNNRSALIAIERIDRPRPPEHRCGVRGFAESGDKCPACHAPGGRHAPEPPTGREP